ncbi:hypothetical protein [Persephonella sp.]|uniref:hypothetical protein n=1 Tax=Persephonella sp. TaxID=2060922 RepID=UPI00261739A0|nr:hypothetical protein [Persephonella sp.]
MKKLIFFPVIMYISSFITAYLFILLFAGISISSKNFDVVKFLLSTFTNPDLYIRCAEISLISLIGLIALLGLIYPIADAAFTGVYMGIVKHFTGHYFLTEALNNFVSNDNFISILMIGIWVSATKFVFGVITDDVYELSAKRVYIEKDDD